MTQRKIGSERRAQFKEIARRIVGADRFARRLGLSQNTIGEIERALIAAFWEGAKEQASPSTKAGPDGLTWIQIPPRSRETLINMTFQFSSRFGIVTDEVSQIERFEQGGKLRWRTVDLSGRRSEWSVANGSVRPLVELGLLRPSKSEPEVFELSEDAILLCKGYWARSDSNDPTLPKISLR